MIYFTADTHFGHESIIHLCNRPFVSVEQMDETLIANWNGKVKGNDTVYILGDMFYRSANVDAILRRLKGSKRLLVGNHDGSWLEKTDTAQYFTSVDRFLEMSDGKRLLTLCHYPLLTWKHAARSFMLHGHLHNNTEEAFRCWTAGCDRLLNAGVDINGFAPVTFDELLENNRLFKNTNRQ